MYICTWLRVHHSTKARQKIYAGVLGTWLHLLANFLFSVDTKAMFPFFSKTQLVQHYIDTLGALHFGGRVMIIDTNAALKILNKYFPK